MGLGTNGSWPLLHLKRQHLADQGKKGRRFSGNGNLEKTVQRPKRARPIMLGAGVSLGVGAGLSIAGGSPQATQPALPFPAPLSAS